MAGLKCGYEVTKRTATNQGSLLSGKDPTAFSVADPLRLWIVQITLIILTSQLLSLGLARIRQPKVIAEVLTGILLGPTAFGRIPGFTQHIFPDESRAFLSLAANIGLVLFLFIVGLEIDAKVVRRNARPSLTVAVGGMVLPFALGSALAIPIYHRFIDPAIQFTHFLLFVGVAFAITAFPVLARILTELKLLDTTVGICVLSAGVTNDVIGWCLLALSVALVNATSALTAVYVLLAGIGWTLFLLFPIRIFFSWLAHKTGSIEDGPSPFFMTSTVLLVFGSAFFTDIIGIHAVFGAFVAGLVIPRKGGLAIAITTAVEDVVTIIFLPIYFTLSGLSTDLGLLNDGITWAFTIAIIVVAWIGKFCGCLIAARIAGFNLREAAAIGTLMSCKGLVELIVLNVGLSAGILDVRVFSMFVLEALVLTFMTTPVVLQIFPSKYRVRAVAAGANFASVEGGDKQRGLDRTGTPPTVHDSKTNFMVVLDKIEHLPLMMSLTALLQPPTLLDSTPVSGPSRGSNSATKQASIDTLRLLELSSRTSAVMMSSVAEDLLRTDPLLDAFRAFAELNSFSVTSSLSIVPHQQFAASIVEHARNCGSHLVLLPWLPPLHPDRLDHGSDKTHLVPSTNPFEAMFRAEQVKPNVHSLVVRNVFAQSDVDVALFVDRPRASGGVQHGHHVMLPFLGGPDDRLALDLVIQMCANPNVTAVIMNITIVEGDSSSEHVTATPGLSEGHNTIMDSAHNTVFPDTIYGQLTTQTRLESETADNILWARYASPTDHSIPHPPLVTSALTRIQFTELQTATPVHAILQSTAEAAEHATQLHKKFSVVLGRGKRLAESHHQEVSGLMREAQAAGMSNQIGAEVRKTVGDVATALIVGGSRTGLVVVQAAGHNGALPQSL